MRKGRIWMAAALIGALVLALYARHQSNRTLTAVEAVSKGYVSVSIAYGPARQAADAAPDADKGGGVGPGADSGSDVIAVTFTRSAAAPDREISVTIPVGTVIHNGDSTSQRLMTAAPVTVRLAPGVSQVAVSVPTYCLDAFLSKPTPTSTLTLPERAPAFVFGQASDEDRELNPVRKLADCLSGASQPFSERQDAVWLVNEGLFNKPFAEAKTFLYEHWRSALADGAERQMTDGKAAYRDAIRLQNPGISQGDLEAALAAITPAVVEASVESHAREQSEQNATDFFDAKTSLGECGYDIDKLAFFHG
jgi:hypothetical protein